MLDTIKFEMYAPLKVPCQCQIPLPSGKFIRLWVDPTQSYLTRVECSLPKLVYGHNGRLIDDQEELDRAMEQLREAVAKVADVPDSGVWVPSRCDLVWQLGGMEAGKVIDVLAGFRFPGIQKPAMHVAGQSVAWRGAKSRFMVSAYDKAKQLRVEGDVLRIEVRLCGKVFRKRLGHRDWRNFADLYAVYREVILSLPTLPKASTEHSMLTALTMCSGPEMAEQVVMVITRNKETIRKYRREIRLAQAKLPSSLVWADIFPAATPPPPVTIEPAKRIPTFHYLGKYRAGFRGFPRIAKFKPTRASVIPAKVCGKSAQVAERREMKPKPGT
jgi:hypothetical protein